MFFSLYDTDIDNGLDYKMNLRLIDAEFVKNKTK